MARSRTVLTLSLLLIALGAASPAQGAVTCVFGAGTATVTMSTGGDSALIVVGTGANAGRIMAGPNPSAPPCSTATVANTDTIVVNGTTGAETVTIDLTTGQFAPERRPRVRAPPRSSSSSTSRRAFRTVSPLPEARAPTLLCWERAART